MLHTQGRLLPTTATEENPKTSPGGCSGDSISQAAGARPHNNFETLGQGYRDLHRDPQNSSWQWGCYCFILAKPPFQVAGPRLPAPPPRAALPGPARTPQPRAPQPCAPPATRWLGLCPAGLHRAKALTSAGLRSPRACAEPDKWYAMTRGMITLLLLVIIRVNAI